MKQEGLFIVETNSIKGGVILMNSVIYYPSFEIEDSGWLKFALIYMKEVSPIIPASAYNSLSPSYKGIITNCNLFKPYEPDYIEGNAASLRAIGQLERILRYPLKSIRYFEHREYYEHWKVAKFQDYEIFKEKYSGDFLDFCLENGIGHRSRNGIKVTEEVAFIYMSILANEVSKGRNATPITDKKKYNDLLLLINKLDPRTERRNNLARRVIDLQLPGNLEELDIKTLMKLRETDKFERKLRAFHQTLDNYFNNIGMGEDSTADYIDSLNESIESLHSEIASPSLNIFTVGFQVFLKGEVSIPELIPALTSLNEIKKKYTQIGESNNRITKQYFTDLRNLKLKIKGERYVNKTKNASTRR